LKQACHWPRRGVFATDKTRKNKQKQALTI
jgi:hypothetical protein